MPPLRFIFLFGGIGIGMMPEKAINHGRAIQTITWTDGRAVMSATEKSRLVFISEYHGDHDEDWVLVVEGDKEMARHNTRFIESIIWAD